jgi:hypothetical protein
VCSSDLIADETIEYKGGTLAGITADAPADSSLTLGKNGSGFIYLKHGQTITFSNISIEWKINVKELYDANYVATYSLNGNQSEAPGILGTGFITLAKGENYTIDYTNDRKEIILTGVESNEMADLGFLLLACSLAALGTAVLFIRTRSKHMYRQ